MFSNVNLIYIFLFVRILELPSAVVCIDDTIQLHDTGSEVRCKFQPNSWDCYNNGQKVKHRFYYDVKMQSCKTYQYGGCSLNYNSFDMLSDCSTYCEDAGNHELSNQEMDKLAADVICRLQPEFGSCFGYKPMFYYDISTRTCKGFSFSGCGGNHNRFDNKHACIDFCESSMPEYKLD